MGVYLKGKRIAPVKILKTGGEYNIEVIEEADGTQTLNITDWDYVMPEFDPIFANNSWTQISKISEVIKANNYTSSQVKEVFGWDLQTDTKVDIGKDGVSRTFHFNGFNHDDLSDGTGKAGITFGMVDCEPTTYRMNNSSSNAGGYPATTMKTETLPMIKALLSDELQSVIKSVNKKSANGGGANFSEIITTSEDLFLYAAAEIFNSTGNAQNASEEGTIYEYWDGSDSAKRRKKRDTDGDGIAETNVAYSLRSCYNSTNQFCSVMVSGGSITQGSATYARAISYALCI